MLRSAGLTLPSQALTLPSPKERVRVGGRRIRETTRRRFVGITYQYNVTANWLYW